MMVVASPMLALANSENSNAPATAGNSASAPGLADGTAPGNSENAPGQQTDTDAVTASAPADPGNSGDAPGQTKTDSGPPETSNAGGNSASGGGATTQAGGGGNPNAGGANANGGGGNPNSGDVGSDNGDPAHEGDCDQNDDGVGGAYDANCDGTHQNPGPGNSDNSPGKPADGTVGKADNKNPKGQQPGGSDHNKGYECEPGQTNKGVGKGNPAHTGCTSGGDEPCPPGTDHAGEFVTPCNDSPDKIWICHVNNGVNDYVVINVSKNSKQEENGTGHAGHDGDVTLSATTREAALAEAAIDCVEPLTVQVCSASGNTWVAAEILKSTYDANPSAYRLWTGDAADCTTIIVTNKDCAGFELPNDLNNTCPGPVDQFDCAGHLLPNDHAATECDETEEPPEVLPVTLCPDGSVMPASGECEEDVLPDFVLGIRLNNDPVAPAVLPNTLQAPKGAVLPFTGGNLLPFLLVGTAMVGVGGTTLMRRKK